MIDDTTRRGWECGIYTRRHIEYLYQCLDKLETENTHNAMLLASLKAQEEKARSDAGVKTRILSAKEAHEGMISGLAHTLSLLSEEDREHVIGMARAWSQGMAYAGDTK
jgi:hypothetical protein